MKKEKIIKVIFITVLFLNVFFVERASGAGSSQVDNSKVIFCISETPSLNQFPQIDVNFRVFDENINPIGNISEEDIRITENGQISIPVSSGMRVNELDLGADFYILIDRGNRTDQVSVKHVLSTFLEDYDQTKDQVQIFTDEGNQANPYYNSNSSINLFNLVNDYPTAKIGSFRVVDTAVRTVLTEIENSPTECQRPRFLFLILGDTAIAEKRLLEVIQEAKSSFTKVILFHTATAGGELNLGSSYRSLVETNGGYYVSLLDGGEQVFFNSINDYRKSYSVSYRSSNSLGGDRQIGIVYKDANLVTLGNTTYSISVLPPQVNLIVPFTIERTATNVINSEYIYDKVEEVGILEVNFPDNFVRDIESATLIINHSGLPATRVPINLSAVGQNYQFRWRLGDLENVRRNDLVIQVEVVDELNMVVTSPEVPIVVLSYIPPIQWIERYLNYLLVLLIFVLIIVIFLMRQQIIWAAGNVRRGITEVVGFVRKTIVGGGKRRILLASLKIIDGPQDIVGHELKVYTEIVKLGRDPQKADLIFYKPDFNSSVSGLHARLEYVNQRWRIVAVSQSGSETFVDDIAIPFNEPYSLKNGQTVRLGYFAQQPVVFTFNIVNISSQTTNTGSDDPKKTDLSDSIISGSISKLSTEKKKEIKSQKQGQADDFFDEFRDR